ncbi:MAG: oligopeptide/dipeptide ABC transporter ATP-binding protein [Alphaproteobacteria bacterium]
MPETLVEVRGLTKTYQVGNTVVHALRDLDLEVERGECVAIVGESGSGKTTLGHLVLGIEPPTAGEILFDGEALPTRRSRPFRRRLQLVQQNPMSALNPKRTIYRSIVLPIAVHRLVPRRQYRDRVVELLEIVGLPPDYLNRYPHVLSGGQRQRVALARALAAEPDCIVLDEPTSALDVSVQARVLELLVNLRQRFDLTYIFITHDLGVVRNISSRVCVLYRGRAVELGPTPAIFAAPKHRYTQMLLSSVPVVTPEEEASKPDWPWDRTVASGEGVAETGCPFRPRCAFAVDACKSTLPALDAKEPGHVAACHNPGTAEDVRRDPLVRAG